MVVPVCKCLWLNGFHSYGNETKGGASNRVRIGALEMFDVAFYDENSSLVYLRGWTTISCEVGCLMAGDNRLISVIFSYGCRNRVLNDILRLQEPGLSCSTRSLKFQKCIECNRLVRTGTHFLLFLYLVCYVLGTDKSTLRLLRVVLILPRMMSVSGFLTGKWKGHFRADGPYANGIFCPNQPSFATTTSENNNQSLRQRTDHRFLLLLLNFVFKGWFSIRPLTLVSLNHFSWIAAIQCSTDQGQLGNQSISGLIGWPLLHNADHAPPTTTSKTQTTLSMVKEQQCHHVATTKESMMAKESMMECCSRRTISPRDWPVLSTGNEEISTMSELQWHRGADGHSKMASVTPAFGLGPCPNVGCCAKGQQVATVPDIVQKPNCGVDSQQLNPLNQQMQGSTAW